MNLKCVRVVYATEKCRFDLPALISVASFTSFRETVHDLD